MRRHNGIYRVDELLDAIYRVDLPQREWQRIVAEHVYERRGLGTGLLAYEFDASSGDGHVQVGTVVDLGDIGEFYDLTRPMHNRQVGPDYELVVARGTHSGTTRETLHRAGVRDMQSSVIIRGIESLGYSDIWAVCSVNPDATGIAFAIPCAGEESMLPAGATEEWTRVGVHIAASARLRRRLARGGYEEAAGVFSPDGCAEHLSSEAEADREALRQFIKALDKARARLHRGKDEDLLSLWRGLVQGRWSVFDQVDTDGKHFIVVHENDPDAAGPKRLTRRETQVATYAAQGHTNKVIAYELGIARTTVATHLRTALSKLGLRRRTDLVWLYGHVSGGGGTLGEVLCCGGE